MNANEMNDNEILQKIGAKLRELRLEQNIKQKEIADRCGLSNFSISQMETGHNTSLLSFVQVLRALNRLDMLDSFLQKKELDPLVYEEFLLSQQPKRKRVSRIAAEPNIPSVEDMFQHPAVKPYFADEDDESSLPLVADDSEVE